MTTDVQKFFKDNLSRLDAQTDPEAWNMNCGLLALAESVAALQQDIRRIERQNSELLQRLKAL